MPVCAVCGGGAPHLYCFLLWEAAMRYTIQKSSYKDFSVFEKNKRPGRSYFIPFSTRAALGGTDYLHEREQSDRVQLLSRSDWDFCYYAHVSELPNVLDTDSALFDRVHVPSTWQRTGYDQIAYINSRYPFKKNPPHFPEDTAVGVYRKKFDFSGSSHALLTFLGVAGALEVYLNGEYVGYSEGSHNPAEFDISHLVRGGENELVCVVFKWSNGTYLECQDMFRENGIFRDVYVTARDEVYIEDFTVRPRFDDPQYSLEVRLQGHFSPGCTVRAQFSGAGVQSQVDLDENMMAYLTGLSPIEWSAERPALCEAVFTLFENGEERECLRAYIGFKHIEIRGEVFCFNNRPIKLKGVNHHDTHPTKGYAMGIDDLERDVQLMKTYNCNAVRTSHYPPDPLFLTMCDVYGLYVVDEADIETHGFYDVHGTYRPGRLSNDLRWKDHYLDRVARMYLRDKNHPSITMWSLGNESGGYKCQDVCYDYLKKHDPSTPVHYEGVNRSKRWAYDVVSHMYATPELMRAVKNGKAGKKYRGKPFFQCEYAHAMGNGPGGLETYMQLFLSSDQFMGGCIWEWADHAVYDENAKYKWTYGGDHGEVLHDGNFCCDGLFFPDRTPSSGALEMKAVYRPLRARYLGDGRYQIWNTNAFVDSSNIAIRFELLENGQCVYSDDAALCIAPGEKAEFVPQPVQFAAGSDVRANFIYTDRTTGLEIAREQCTVQEAFASAPFDKAQPLHRKENTFTAEAAGASFTVDKTTGLLTGYRVNGAEFLNPSPIDAAGFVPGVFRPVIDNDRNLQIYWKFIGLDTARAVCASCRRRGKSVVSVFNIVTRGLFVLARAKVTYALDSAGRLKVSASLSRVCPLPLVLPRFGLRAELPASAEQVRYWGCGPEENYGDFKAHAPLGIYDTTVSRFGYEYIKPQDSGNRTDVRFAEIIGPSAAFRISAGNAPVNLNVSHKLYRDYAHAGHIEDVPDRGLTTLCVDGFVRGTGSGSCGPLTEAPYKIKLRPFSPLRYSFVVERIKQ